MTVYGLRSKMTYYVDIQVNCFWEFSFLLTARVALHMSTSGWLVLSWKKNDKHLIFLITFFTINQSAGSENSCLRSPQCDSEPRQSSWVERNFSVSASLREMSYSLQIDMWPSVHVDILILAALKDKCSFVLIMNLTISCQSDEATSAHD